MVTGAVLLVVVAIIVSLALGGTRLSTVLTPGTSQPPQLGSFAGYIQFGSVDQVSATWRVPTIAQTSRDGGASTWIGLQGPADQEFYQIGTTESREGGDLFYDAFWSDPKEGFHAQFLMNVAAGDEIEASIAEEKGSWLATIRDVTRARRQAAPTATADFRNLQLAEWIQEDPSLPQHGHVPYPQIGSTTMWQLKANDAAPVYAGLQPQWMVLPRGQRVEPEPLSNDQFITKEAPAEKT